MENNPRYDYDAIVVGFGMPPKLHIMKRAQPSLRCTLVFISRMERVLSLRLC